MRAVKVRHPLDGAMQIDRAVVAGLAQKRDHTLRLPERIGADQMRAVGEQPTMFEELRDLRGSRRVAEDRQAEGRFRDEGVAADEFETRAGRIGRPPDTTSRNPPCSIRIWAEPSTWPAGNKVTRTPPMLRGSR